MLPERKISFSTFISWLKRKNQNEKYRFSKEGCVLAMYFNEVCPCECTTHKMNDDSDDCCIVCLCRTTILTEWDMYDFDYKSEYTTCYIFNEDQRRLINEIGKRLHDEYTIKEVLDAISSLVEGL